MRKLLPVLLVLALPVFAQDTRPFTNATDSSCDISTQPAATLLIPYFELEYGPASTARTTLFTITNVTSRPQIASVTIWTNLDHPVMNFPVFLTGYDVQAINLYDVLVRGLIAPPSGTTSRTTPGRRSQPNMNNPNFLPSAATNCERIPTNLPSGLLLDVENAFKTGRTSICSQPVAIPNANLATGYITIDLMATCTSDHPLRESYWDQLLFDNVLTGDWQIIAPSGTTGNYAEGAPAVHIRAVPEGGSAGSSTVSPLPFTFYDRLTPAGKRRTDRRQPLPTTFAARFIEGSNASFDTQFIVWRESMTGGPRQCGDVASNNAPLAEIVRFDERENPTVKTSESSLPVSSSVRTASELFPPLSNDVAGWMYLNLNNGGSSAYSASNNFDLVTDSSTVRGLRQSQAWVVTRMAAEGRYATGIEVTALGNGCGTAPASPTMAASNATVRPIGPARTTLNDALPASPAVTHRNDDSCDVAQLPAATLLLPYFEVDVNSDVSSSQTTLFTVVNTTNQPQIARATIWTDWSFPVISFDIFLTGYDVQAINIRDILMSGVLPGTSSNATRGSRSLAGNDRFLANAATACANLPRVLPATITEAIRRALTQGTIPQSCSSDRVGGAHANAIGYVTIDVVATCSGKSPKDAGAIGELLFDNVLTGDYQFVTPNSASGNFALGSPLVHIRAIGEGGAAGSQVATNLNRTFYDGFYGGTHRDRRQPLPTRFAGRYIEGGGTSFLTDFLIWREPARAADAICSNYDENLTAYVEAVRFDERENPTTVARPDVTIGFPEAPQLLASSSRLPSSDEYFPPLQSGDVAGWMYLNLARPESNNQISAAQAWVVTAMSAEGRYAVGADATSLGNGCSQVRGTTSEDSVTNPIQP
ncbi:MAG TPA: hypothetical protein VGF48_15795 [Thermoanaerobaculia bacterium]|jgi:hypothetical protein